MRPTALRPLVVVCAVLALATACGGGSDSPAPDHRAMTTVPDVVGLSPDKAIAGLCAAKLFPGELSIMRLSNPVRDPDLALRASRVLETLPGAGERVPVGTSIPLRVSIPRNTALAYPAGCSPSR